MADPALRVEVDDVATFDMGSVPISIASDSPGATTSSTAGPCSLATGRVVFSHAGTCTVTVTQAATDGFEAASASREITIDKGLRSFEPPAGFTWADLPLLIGTQPDSAPTPTFSTLTTNICAVSKAGVIDVPGPYDGRAGVCRVVAAGAATADWAAVNETFDVEIGRAVVRIRVVPGQDTAFTFEQGLTVTIDLDIVENDGGAEIGADSDSAVCDPYAEMDWEHAKVHVRVSFSDAGECPLDFYAIAPGAFDYAMEVPPPVVLVAEPVDDGDTASSKTWR